MTMTVARAEHTATLLADGKVLIAGGVDSLGAPLASAELYDPASHSFTPTGSMATARAGHTATLLANGEVLIAAGETAGSMAKGSVNTSSAELYDPSAGRFTPTGDMLASGFSWNGFAPLLPDGRVFVALDSNAELYDPVTGTFALIAGYGSSSIQVNAVALLESGSLLLLGCSNCTATGEGVTAIYDPKSNTFRTAAPLGTDVPTVTVLKDGTVLVDDANEFSVDDVHLYNPDSGAFTDLGSALGDHEFSTATRLNDGTVLIAGGQGAGGAGHGLVERYVPGGPPFVAAPSLRVGRHNHTATLLPDGTVLFAGGWSNWPQSTASAEIYPTAGL
jgi:hypothetical protein